MFHSSRNRFSKIRWPFLACAILISASASWLASNAQCLSAGQPPVKPAGKTSLEGKWDGRYVDSMGGKGKGVYDFREEKDGQLIVKVTWGKDQSMDLTGERLGPNALRLTGKHGDTVYRYIGDMQKGDLVLHYTAEDAKPEKSHFGLSRLTRQKI